MTPVRDLLPRASAVSLGAAAKVRLGVFAPTDERCYRERFNAHREKTKTFLAIIEAFFSTSRLQEIVDRLRQRTYEEVEDVECVKLGSLYADLHENNEVRIPGAFYTTADKVQPFLEDLRLWIRLFEGNVRPMFDEVATCPAADCRKWLDTVKGIL